jgi:hypothetical protein
MKKTALNIESTTETKEQQKKNERYHTPGQALDPGPQATPFRPKGRGMFPCDLGSHSEMEPTCWFRFSRSFENHKFPYEKPELTKLGNVKNMTSYVTGSLNFG